MLSLTILISGILAATATATKYCTSLDSNLSVTDALWDGQCFYPKPDKKFEVDQYLGRWYQVAGTRVSFTTGCSCIFAEYTLNANGTVGVYNSCQLGDRRFYIRGLATAADEVYGSDGTFIVGFPTDTPEDCPGPNYIVQKYSKQWAIVQTANFTTLFLLSRKQNPSEVDINLWLGRAEKLGTDLSDVIRTNQTSCKFT